VIPTSTQEDQSGVEKWSFSFGSNRKLQLANQMVPSVGA